LSFVKKRSISIRGHRTSFSLEDVFYRELQEIAARRAIPVAALIGEVDAARPKEANLSSALRIYVLDQVKASAHG
jgi:predicted DNA-binding ribbon-helix-helix protein